MRTRHGLPLALLLAGCTLGPDYKRPELPVPGNWRQVSTPEQESLANTPWWQLFQDPELVHLIEGALAENKDLKIAVERIEEARAYYGIARSALYPQLDLYASAARVRTSANGVPALPAGVENEDNLFTAGASAFWELDFFGRTRRASEAQLAQLYAAEQSRRAVVLALVADVARAYVELRDLDGRLAISKRTLQSRVEYEQLARDRFEGGKTSELDWRQAEAEMHRTESLVHDFEQLVTQKENELSALLGRNPGEITRGKTMDDIVVPPSVPAGLPSELLERRPDVRAAEEELAGATARIGAAKALLWPSIAITGSFGWESSEMGTLLDSPSQSWSIGANLLQPIFNGGLNRRRVEVSESQQRQALYAYERSVLQAFREVEDQLVALRQSGVRLTSERGRLAAERKVLELAELRYRGGVSNYLEVLDAQRSLFNAELDAAEAQRAQLVALIQLYKSLGGGWPQQPEEQPAEAQQPEGEKKP